MKKENINTSINISLIVLVTAVLIAWLGIVVLTGCGGELIEQASQPVPAPVMVEDVGKQPEATVEEAVGETDEREIAVYEEVAYDNVEQVTKQENTTTLNNAIVRLYDPETCLVLYYDKFGDSRPVTAVSLWDIWDASKVRERFPECD